MSDEFHPVNHNPNSESRSSALVQWNRTQINRCLLPVLRYADVEEDERISNAERSDRKAAALTAIRACPDAYRQLARVWREGSDEQVEQWFGWIECDPELLERAFDLIDCGATAGGDAPEKEKGAAFDRDLYFMQLFRITDGGEAVDLSYPFEQYYFCDEVIYRDYLLRRLELADKCKAWIRHYLPYYTRIRAWYRENGGESAISDREYRAYMELLDYFMARISFEDKLRDERQSLEYERGGLGWFNRRKKHEIDRRLYELVTEELKLKLDDTQERYDAYESQFSRQRDDWLTELEHAPWTAFGRKKELKEKLAALERDLEDYRAKLGLDELQAQYRKRKTT